MKVFISWSGERSKAVAQALRDWLPNVIQAVEPWMSEADIAKGARWSLDMARELDETRVGIICLTPENLNAAWILFEAGALSKTLEETYVCPYLLDLRPADLEGPLAQFQAAMGNEEDTRKLVQTINRALGDEALAEERVNKAFRVWWSQLEESLANIPAAEGKPESQRPLREMVEEMLVSVRALERQVIEGRKRQEQAAAETVNLSSMDELMRRYTFLRQDLERLLAEGRRDDAGHVQRRLKRLEREIALRREAEK